jgi:hypothetical protein
MPNLPTILSCLIAVVVLIPMFLRLRLKIYFKYFIFLPLPPFSSKWQICFVLKTTFYTHKFRLINRANEVEC